MTRPDPLVPVVPLEAEQTPRWWPWLRLALVLPLLALTALFLLPPLLDVPVYQVQGGQIMARSVASRTVIPAGTPVRTEPVRLARKVVGSARTGYTVGRFSTAQGRAVRVYSDGSHGARALVFATRPEETVLTPDNPQALLEAWRSGSTGDFRAARSPGFDGWLLLTLLPVVPLMALLFRRPRLQYLQEENALLVRTASSVTRFPRGHVSAVLTREHLGARLFGTAMPGYYTGTFSLRGGSVQAAASSSRPEQAVIVTHGHRRYYLTPQDPEALVAWLSRRP